MPQSKAPSREERTAPSSILTRPRIDRNVKEFPTFQTGPGKGDGSGFAGPLHQPARPHVALIGNTFKADRQGILVNYYTARNGQQYGPYSEETVRTYLSAGSLLLSDYIREESSASWVTIPQLLPWAASIAPSQQYSTPYLVQAAHPYPAQQAQPYGMAPTQIVPPNLHWVVVLLLCITWIFPFLWAIMQARFAKKIDPTSSATWQLVIWFVLSIGLAAVDIAVATGNGGPDGPMWQLGLAVVVFICYFKGIFGIRQSMEKYYNSVEPIHLKLGGAMTFFFGILYLQFHMSRIARWKKTGILEA